MITVTATTVMITQLIIPISHPPSYFKEYTLCINTLHKKQENDSLESPSYVLLTVNCFLLIDSLPAFRNEAILRRLALCLLFGFPLALGNEFFAEINTRDEMPIVIRP